ncbi:unnamed protein product [Cylindrotheca closterium]|uniref:TLC domain-containing protein n=1 Tax=Cylindrotheca closterium TaxID=2856 RepID=A0AAD2FUF7_9STRA|nr:unnamed protein product [Cylindrotheca closterium]
MPEVGVSLALRKRNSLLSGTGELAVRKPKQRQRSSYTRVVGQKAKEKRRTNASLQIFIEAGSLYVLCIILPNIVSGIGSALKSVLEDNAVFRKATTEVCLGPFLNRFQYCQQLLLRTHGHDASSTPLTAVIAPDAGISDVAIVVFLSISLAIIRLGLVHILVPGYDQPKRMRAFVRCKSIHLLSSQYTGNGTPKPLKLEAIDDSVLSSLPHMPSLEPNPISNSDSTNSATSEADANVAFQYRVERMGPAAIQTSKLDYESLGGAKKEELWGQWEQALDVLQDDNDDDDDSPPPPAVSSGLISSSSAHSLQALLHQVNPGGPRARRESFKQDDLLSFTSPKFATAAFRLFYCTISCTIALFYFLDADFWPAAVGGNGNTKNCWNLSSVGPTVMESFDQHNTVLRRYFLLQASYHVQSGFFASFTAILLWLVSSSPKNQEEGDEEGAKFCGFIPYGMITLNNVKTLLQHCFAVGLITFIFLFSSLRRLGAIGIFSFDASSWALHLLQLSINDSSQRVTPSCIRLLHRGVVIPFFCFTRFYIFPFVIGYSALEESQDWLRQLENMLVPGVAKHIHGAFVVSFLVVMAINILYFHRLLYHPHVQEALQHSKHGSKKGPS